MKLWHARLTWFHIPGLLLATMLPTSSLASEGVAMITDVAGKCVVTSQQSQKTCEILTYLQQGDEIEFASGSAITLAFFRGSAEYSFKGKGIVQITSDKPVVKSGKQAKSRTLLLAKETGLGPAVSSDYSQAAIVLRGSARQKKLALISPGNTNLLSRTPEFHWKAMQQGTQYRFVLYDEAGKSLLEQSTTSNQLSLPPTMKLDEDTYYTWQIEARAPGGESYSASADFLVVSSSERQRIDKLRPGKSATFGERVLFAAVLEQSGFKHEAQQAWKKLLKEKPGDPVLVSKAKPD